MAFFKMRGDIKQKQILQQMFLHRNNFFKELELYDSYKARKFLDLNIFESPEVKIQVFPE